MDILKHNPISLLITFLNYTSSNFILPLAERNAEEGFTSFDSIAISVFLDDLLHFLNGSEPGDKMKKMGIWG
jgi:hypothetical protein